jgi:hypothetical protein
VAVLENWLLTLSDHLRCPLDLFTGSNVSAEKREDSAAEFRLSADAALLPRIRPSHERLARFPGMALPSDLPQAIETLRCEHYMGASRADRFLRLGYYLLRPILGTPIRRTVHQAVFRSRQTGFPNWPVDCSVEEIFDGLIKLALNAFGMQEIPLIWFWPDAHRSALMMTHDVEEELGARHCQMVMNLDESFNLRSAFQLVPEGRYTGVQELISEIRERGFEANLHDLDHDGRLYEDETRFRARAKKINMYSHRYGTKGFRAGSMHRNQQWLNLLDVEYDMSVPNVAHLEPQGGGCCTVMPYFIGDVLELPLTTVQDHGLFYILKEESIALWKKQIDLISARHGLVSFIVHPDYIVRQQERQIYIDLLQHISNLTADRNLWAAVPGEINTWWRERNQMRLQRTSTGWRIQGPGSERARVAYACLMDGQLTYSIEESSQIPEGVRKNNVSVAPH